MVGAGIRWGLNEAHRNDLGLAACGNQNSAWFGLRRMLLGYASGAVAADEPTAALHGIEPYAEVGGLEAELAGALAHLLQALQDWWTLAGTPATPAIWGERGRALLTGIVKAESEADRQALSALQEGLITWQAACEEAGFNDALPLSVLRPAWQEAMETPKLNQRFQAGGVTFCTLMPMRAIPFQVVCLLGMNDGDYPRRTTRSDFDLMGLAGTGRPGDRSRRDDDRQLMLEALLSARRVLYVSWCGRSVRDNSEQPPSVLVSQLRDYLSAGWGQDSVSSRTTQHPLQPFSRRYFEAGNPLLTYAREWRLAHEGQDAATDGGTLASPPLAAFLPDPNVALTLTQLTYFLRQPVKAFFRQRLLVQFDEAEEENADDECFALDGLQEYALIQQVLASAMAQADEHQPAFVTRSLAHIRQAGELPLQGFGDLKQQALQQTLTTLLQAWAAELARFPQATERQSVRQSAGEVVLEDWIDHLRRGEVASDAGPGQQASVVTAWLELQPGKILEKGKKPLARPDKLLGPWVRSLAIAASGLQAQGVLVGRDGVVDISPMPHDQACDTLGMLLTVWQDGMNSPLPLPPKTALAWLAHKNPVAQYEGGYMQSAEVQEPCLARMFPDFDALTEDGRFAQLARQVYAPLLDWTSQHVTARFHAEAQAMA